jgi:hypothetical protein
LRAQASVEFLVALLFLLSVCALFISTVGRQHEAFSSSLQLAADGRERAGENLFADEMALFGRKVALVENAVVAPRAGFVQNATWVGGKIIVEVGAYEPI